MVEAEKMLLSTPSLADASEFKNDDDSCETCGFEKMELTWSVSRDEIKLELIELSNVAGNAARALFEIELINSGFIRLLNSVWLIPALNLTNLI